LEYREIGMSGSVLLFSGAVPGLASLVSGRFPVVGPVHRLPDDLSPDQRQSVRAYVAPGSASAAITDALPNLGLVACLGSGYDGIDVSGLRRRGVAVTHAPGANAASVAEHAMALLLASCRRVVSGDRYIRDGQWGAAGSKSRGPYVRGLAGSRVGILGLGAIGAKIAARLAGFEVEIAYHNRKPLPGSPYGYFDTALALASWADILVVALRAGESTRRLVDAEMIATLGPQGYLINISRGSVVDEQALIAALSSGALAGAGLDVFAEEPNVDQRLGALPNVVMTPHEGGMTSSATNAARVMLMANLEAFFAGRPLPNPVPG
jgi:hydroxypyruvate reductase